MPFAAALVLFLFAFIVAASLISGSGAFNSALSLSIIPIFLGMFLFSYLLAIFQSSMGYVLAVFLVAAFAFMYYAFREAAKAEEARNAGVMAGLFWLSFILISFYSALWPVFMFMLVSLYNLRTVCPK